MESTESAGQRRVTVAIWLLRATWFIAPLAAGPSLDDLVEVEPASLATGATIGLWAVWTVTLLASFVPRPVTLTLVRLTMPAGLLVVTAAVVGEGGASGVAAVAVVAAATVISFLPVTSDTFVDGASYGSERRFALRAPGLLLLGPVELAWVAVVAGLTVGPLLLAAQRWTWGALALAVGLPLAAVAARALHGLSRRWIVFVPAGLVVHDLMALTDPVLFPRRSIRSLRAAPAGTDALDLTLGAPGLAVEVRCSDPPSAALGPLARPRGERAALATVVVTPSRPGALLDEAERRRFRMA